MFNIQEADILVVDDQPDNLKLLVGMLRQTGYMVRAAIDGKTALMSLEKQHPDLILLDINMPEMNGYQVAKRLKENPATHEIPIIFISALDDTDSIVNAFEYGGVDYVSKPFQFAEVNARIRAHLTLHFQRQQLIYFLERDKQQIEEIRRSEEQYRDLFNNASDIIQSVDAEGIFIYTNSAWHRKLGYTPDEIVHMTFTDIIHEDHLAHCMKVFKDIRQQPDTNQRIETIFVTKSDTEVVVQGNINCRYDPEWGFHTRGIFRDITEQRAAEKQALQFALEQERHQMLSDFIRDTSHELRTPLSIISQQLYFIKRLATDERQIQKADFADNQVREIDHIIGQLHDFVALNAQRTIETQHIDVFQWVQDCLLECEEQARQAQIRIIADVADNLPCIVGHLALLRQALSELITNAIRFSPKETEILISARQIDDAFVQVAVIDHGSGIAFEYHDKIFTPLFKINEARTPDGSGVGLGLSMVKRIVELHDGEVKIFNSNNKLGTTIKINLPSRCN